MKRNRFSEEQIIKALKSREAGVKVSELCREIGIVEQTFYRWRAKYAGMEVSETKCLKVVEAENGKLKAQQHEVRSTLSTLWLFDVAWFAKEQRTGSEQETYL